MGLFDFLLGTTRKVSRSAKAVREGTRGPPAKAFQKAGQKTLKQIRKKRWPTHLNTGMTQPVIENHIIKTAGFDAQFEVQVRRLSHPLVNVHIGAYIEGNMIGARWRRFSMEYSPFVSWVDDDEEILEWLGEAVSSL